MTEQQQHDLIETLWRRVAKVERERDRWQGSHPLVAHGYAAQRAAYRDCLELIYATSPQAPGTAERETRPPGRPVEATP